MCIIKITPYPKVEKYIFTLKNANCVHKNVWMYKKIMRMETISSKNNISFQFYYIKIMHSFKLYRKKVPDVYENLIQKI